MGKSRYLILVAVLAVISVLGGFVGSKLDKKLDSIAKEPARKLDSIVGKEPATKTDSIVKEPARKADSIVGLEKGAEKPEGSLLAERYDFGVVFPMGSVTHPSSHGIAVFETKTGLTGQERYLKLQMEDMPELAKSIVSVSIDGTKVGNLSINAQGNGAMGLEMKEGDLFPIVRDGSILEIKAADNSLVASGFFGGN